MEPGQKGLFHSADASRHHGATDSSEKAFHFLIHSWRIQGMKDNIEKQKDLRAPRFEPGTVENKKYNPA